MENNEVTNETVSLPTPKLSLKVAVEDGEKGKEKKEKNEKGDAERLRKSYLRRVNRLKKAQDVANTIPKLQADIQERVDELAKLGIVIDTASSVG